MFQACSEFGSAVLEKGRSMFRRSEPRRLVNVAAAGQPRISRAGLRVAALLAVIVGFLGGAPAFAVVTITPPVDVADYITAGITALGTVVAAAVVGYFGFLVVRLAMKWGRTALGAG